MSLHRTWSQNKLAETHDEAIAGRNESKTGVLATLRSKARPRAGAYSRMAGGADVQAAMPNTM